MAKFVLALVALCALVAAVSGELETHALLAHCQTGREWFAGLTRLPGSFKLPLS